MSYVPPPISAAAPGSVPNHLAWAIISTVLATCLCCPLGLVGIVAIVFSAKVNGRLRASDLDGARRGSANAKTWCWVATALAIIGVLWTIYFFSSGGMAEYQEMFEQMRSDGVISTRGLKADAEKFGELIFDVNSAYFFNHGGYEFAKQLYADDYKAAIKIVGGEQYVFSAAILVHNFDCSFVGTVV